MKSINRPPTALENLIKHFVYPDMLNNKINECDHIHRNIQNPEFIRETRLSYNPIFTAEKKYDIVKASSDDNKIISLLCFYSDPSSFHDKFNNFNMLIKMYELFSKMSVDNYFNQYYNSFCTMFPFLYWHVDYRKKDIPDHITKGLMFNLDQYRKEDEKKSKLIIIKTIQNLMHIKYNKKKLTKEENKELYESIKLVSGIDNLSAENGSRLTKNLEHIIASTYKNSKAVKNLEKIISDKLSNLVLQIQNIENPTSEQLSDLNTIFSTLNTNSLFLSSFEKSQKEKLQYLNEQMNKTEEKKKKMKELKNKINNISNMNREEITLADESKLVDLEKDLGYIKELIEQQPDLIERISNLKKILLFPSWFQLSVEKILYFYNKCIPYIIKNINDIVKNIDNETTMNTKNNLSLLKTKLTDIQKMNIMETPKIKNETFEDLVAELYEINNSMWKTSEKLRINVDELQNLWIKEVFTQHMKLLTYLESEGLKDKIYGVKILYMHDYKFDKISENIKEYSSVGSFLKKNRQDNEIVSVILFQIVYALHKLYETIAFNYTGFLPVNEIFFYITPNYKYNKTNQFYKYKIGNKIYYVPVMPFSIMFDLDKNINLCSICCNHKDKKLCEILNSIGTYNEKLPCKTNTPTLYLFMCIFTMMYTNLKENNKLENLNIFSDIFNVLERYSKLKNDETKKIFELFKKYLDIDITLKLCQKLNNVLTLEDILREGFANFLEVKIDAIEITEPLISCDESNINFYNNNIIDETNKKLQEIIKEYTKFPEQIKTTYDMPKSYPKCNFLASTSNNIQHEITKQKERKQCAKEIINNINNLRYITDLEKIKGKKILYKEKYDPTKTIDVIHETIECNKSQEKEECFNKIMRNNNKQHTKIMNFEIVKNVPEGTPVHLIYLKEMNNADKIIDNMLTENLNNEKKKKKVSNIVKTLKIFLKVSNMMKSLKIWTIMQIKKVVKQLQIFNINI